MNREGPSLVCACPLCQGTAFDVVMNFVNYVNQYNRVSKDMSQYLAMCVSCGAILRLPLEIKPPAKVSDYGEAYYDGCGEDRLSVLRAHVMEGQLLHYKQLHGILHRLTTPTAHRRWLDVGSAGCPTAFDDFEFTTLEPSIDAVVFGQSHFNKDRVKLGVIDHYADDRPFDGIVFLNSLYCSPTPAQSIAKAAALLRDNGMLVISIGNYFVETVSNTPDGRNGHMEDIWRGATMWVYYNRINLTALCETQGLSLKSEFVENSPIHPHQTIRFWVFEKRPPAKPAGFEGGAAKTRDLLDRLLRSFTAQSQAALVALDQPSVAIVGWWEVIDDFWRVHPLRQIHYVVDARQETLRATYCFNGVPLTSFEELAAGVRSGLIKTVVIAAYSRHDEVTQALSRQFAAHGVNIGALTYLMPIRPSPIGRAFDDFLGEKRLVRLLAFEPLLDHLMPK
ncbi:MAG: class I SAM-dependent methyltransferase [Rhodospirillales bacterium]|nr:class I SAM-dependent methyltransferase [Rhodospirillales bacterium]